MVYESRFQTELTYMKQQLPKYKDPQNLRQCNYNNGNGKYPITVLL